MEDGALNSPEDKRREVKKLLSSQNHTVHKKTTNNIKGLLKLLRSLKVATVATGASEPFKYK